MLILTLLSGSAFAQTTPVGGPKPGGAGPCVQIENDCKKNGYISGEASLGKGLWWDCLCPLIATNFPEPSKNVLTVPSDSSLVPACRNLPMGQKIMADCANMMAQKNARQAAKQNAKPAPSAPGGLPGGGVNAKPVKH